MNRSEAGCTLWPSLSQYPGYATGPIELNKTTYLKILLKRNLSERILSISNPDIRAHSFVP